MEIARIVFFDVEPCIQRFHRIPAGIIGATISFEYAGSMWKNLTKTVIFRYFTRICGEDRTYSYKIENAGDTVTIPPVAVNSPRTLLQVGVYATDEEGKTVIPTIWADIGTVWDAATPELAITVE